MKWIKQILSNLLFGKTRIYIQNDDPTEEVVEGKTIDFKPQTHMEFDKHSGTYTLKD